MHFVMNCMQYVEIVTPEVFDGKIRCSRDSLFSQFSAKGIQNVAFWSGVLGHSLSSTCEFWRFDLFGIFIVFGQNNIV